MFGTYSRSAHIFTTSARAIIFKISNIYYIYIYIYRYVVIEIHCYVRYQQSEYHIIWSPQKQLPENIACSLYDS